MTVKDLIAQEIDIDVYDNVCEELGIAFCGPLELTDAGKAEFADVMEYKVELHNPRPNWTNAIVDVDDPDEDVFEHKLARAKLFFESAAGWCSVMDYKKWFKET